MFGFSQIHSFAKSTPVRTSFAVAVAAGAMFALAGSANAQQSCFDGYRMIKNEIPVACARAPITWEGFAIAPPMHREVRPVVHHAMRPVVHHAVRPTAHVRPIVHRTIGEPLTTGSINREQPPSAARVSNSPTTAAGGAECINGYRWHATPGEGDTLPMHCT